MCEEIIQEVFISLWNKRAELVITQSLKAYLYTSVKYQTLNHLRSEKVRYTYASSYVNFTQSKFDNSNEEHIQLHDLKNQLEIEVSKLPEKCQLIFRLSRNEHHSIKSIAELLNLSHKTVENQISKALTRLKASLITYLSLTVMFLI